MDFDPIRRIDPTIPGRVERIERDHQRERARDDQQSPSDDTEEQAFEEEFSEAYEQSRQQERPAAKPDDYQTETPPERESDWNRRLSRDRRTYNDEDDPPSGGDEPGPHIDISA